MEVASLPAPEHQAPAAGPPAPRHGLALVALALAAFALPFQNLMVIPTIPTIEADLGLSVVWGTWLVSGFLLVSSVSAPILGRLGDQWGKRRVLSWSLVVFLVGAIGATVAPSGAVLIICRCLQGSGGAILPLGYSIVKDELPQERLTRAIGILTAAGSLGFGVAVTVSGLLVDALGWRPLFALSALIVALACIGSFLFVPDSSIRVRAKPDVPGAVVLAAGLVSLLLALTEGNHLGWGSVPIGGAVMAAGIALIGFEHRHPWEIVLGLVLAGWGFTLANNGAINLIVRVVRPSETGAATGMSTVIRQIGSSLGTQISAAIVAGGLIAGTQLSTESAYTAAFTMAATGALLSAVLATLARPPRGEPV